MSVAEASPLPSAPAQPPPVPEASPPEEPAPPKRRTTYWLTRFVILRFLGLVYLVGFLVAANQIVPLIGHHGLTPADAMLERVEEHFGGRWEAFRELPTLFYWNCSDAALQGVAWAGVILSAIVLLGYANAPLLLILWALYMSIIHAGGLWYGYGWETQLLETGFLGALLCPVIDPRPFARSSPPVVVLWLFRWLIFRIMIGAFLIKWRGDSCWRDYTALNFHYETQPVPNPLSRYLHLAPAWTQTAGVYWNHFVEFAVPWFAFWPRISRHVAGVLLVSFQVVLIASGNLSFLNWLTIIPALACFDDTFWRWLLPGFLIRAAERADAGEQEERRKTFHRVASFVQKGTALAFAGVVIWLSIPVVKNLLSPQQLMNASIGPVSQLHLVNTYGAFGTVGRERYELVFQGTNDVLPDEAAEWREYEFEVKPGDVMRRPAIITPYHHRLDWQIWFAAMATPNDYPWTVSFVWHLLQNEPTTLQLIANNPFPEAPPRYIRALRYRYKFAPQDNPEGAWWTRERLETWLPPISLSSTNVKNFLQAQGWLYEKSE